MGAQGVLLPTREVDRTMGSVSILPVTCKTALSRTGIPGHRYCLNPYTGCQHACVYCYAPVVLRFSPVSSSWGSIVHAKANVAEVLDRELSRKRGPIGAVMLGSVTDVYQPCEADLGLTRRCLEVLSGRPNAGISILTKSPLVLRDLDALKKWLPAERMHPGSLSVGFTVTVLNDATARAFEPGAPSPSGRLEAARVLVSEGIPVWIFVAPLLPGVGDTPEALERLLTGAAEVGVRTVRFDRLNPYARAVSAIRAVYRARFPDALPDLDLYLRDSRMYCTARDGVVRSLAGKLGIKAGIV